MNIVPELMKSLQELDDQALQGLRKRADAADESFKAFIDKTAEIVGKTYGINFGTAEASGTDKQEPVAIDGSDLQGGSGVGAAKPQ